VQHATPTGVFQLIPLITHIACGIKYVIMCGVAHEIMRVRSEKPTEFTQLELQHDYHPLATPTYPRCHTVKDFPAVNIPTLQRYRL